MGVNIKNIFTLTEDEKAVVPVKLNSEEEYIGYGMWTHLVRNIEIKDISIPRTTLKQTLKTVGLPAETMRDLLLGLKYIDTHKRRSN
jgi:hypothetical protein